MKITSIGNGKIAVDTPYNPDFVARIKKAGARWNPNSKVWEMDERSIDTVRGIMWEVYGQDDTPQEMVNVRVTLDNGMSNLCGPCTLFGRVIASARGRDSGARIGEGIAFEKGSADSGGSVKNWRTVIADGSVIVIYDVPKTAVEQKIDWWTDPKHSSFEIIPAADPLAGLKAEKEALLKRLAEIDEALKDDSPADVACRVVRLQ